MVVEVILTIFVMVTLCCTGLGIEVRGRLSSGGNGLWEARGRGASRIRKMEWRILVWGWRKWGWNCRIIGLVGRGCLRIRACMCSILLMGSACCKGNLMAVCCILPMLIVA